MDMRWLIPLLLVSNHVIGIAVLFYADRRWCDGRLYAWWRSAQDVFHPHRFIALVLQTLVIQLWAVLLACGLYVRLRGAGQKEL